MKKIKLFKNICLLYSIFSFSNYRPLPMSEVTLLSPKTVLKGMHRKPEMTS